MEKENEKLQNEFKDLKSTISHVQQKLQKCEEENGNLSQEITKHKSKISDLSKVSTIKPQFSFSKNPGNPSQFYPRTVFFICVRKLIDFNVLT